jgi:heat shock protein HslJ
LLVGPFALTKKQCPKDIQALEIAFLSALLDKPTWDLVNDDLVIKGPRGALRLARSL